MKTSDFILFASVLAAGAAVYFVARPSPSRPGAEYFAPQTQAAPPAAVSSAPAPNPLGEFAAVAGAALSLYGALDDIFEF